MPVAFVGVLLSMVALGEVLNQAMYALREPYATTAVRLLADVTAAKHVAGGVPASMHDDLCRWTPMGDNSHVSANMSMTLESWLWLGL